MSENTLYHYWRSSCSWRVRWALELKQLKFNYVHVDLLSGEVEREPHISRNPMGQVPALYYNGSIFTESLAIIEMLDEYYQSNKLFFGDISTRAHIRALSEIINSGTQPIQNLPVLDYYSTDAQKRKEWSQFFIRRGLHAFEIQASKSSGKYSVGDEISAADLCLIPQCYNALRNEIDLAEFPTIQKIHTNALKTEAAQNSAPEKYQPK